MPARPPAVLALSACLLFTGFFVGGPAVAEDAAVTVQLTAPAEGAVVSGNVPVAAAVGGAATSVRFEWSANGGASWTLIALDLNGGDGWSGTWSTGSFSGPAVVRATASDALTSASDTSAVTVDNVVATVSVAVSQDPFSPNGDGRKDTTVFTVSPSEPGSVTLSIRNAGGSVVRSWPPRQATGAPLTYSWGGAGGSGILPDGAYTAHAVLTDATGHSASASAGVRIDTRAPTATWVAISPEPHTTQNTMTFTVRLWDDRAGSITTTLRVSSRQWNLAARGPLARDAGERAVTWTPRDPQGRTLFPGRYRGRFEVEDLAGNVAFSSYRAFRNHRAGTAHVYLRLDGAGSRVALTFDDCYDTGAWARILNVLRDKGVDATFFCNGQYVDARHDLAARTTNEGHTVGTHTYDHAYLPGNSVATVETNLRKDQTAWWRASRDTPAPYFRPPYGAYDGNTLAAAGNTAQVRVILWDVDPEDYAVSAPTITSRVLAAARPGSIILLHTLPQTADALPAIIDGLRSRNLTMVTLSRMFETAGYQ